MRRRTNAMLLGLLLTAACTPFPERGTGGFAEHRPTAHPSFAWDSARWAQDTSAEPRFERSGGRWTSLHDDGWSTYQISRLDCVDIKLDRLLQQGAGNRFPAQVWRARRDRRVALRTLSGGLDWDGERNLSRYEDTVNDMAERLGFERSEIRDGGPNFTRRIEECSPASVS